MSTELRSQESKTSVHSQETSMAVKQQVPSASARPQSKSSPYSNSTTVALCCCQLCNGSIIKLQPSFHSLLECSC